MSGSNYHDEDAERDADRETKAKQVLKDWDCPDCNANNPVHDRIGPGEEVHCNYCGNEYKVHISDEGKVKLKAL